MIKLPIICIDPGHGGYDPGAVAQDVKEKDITLKIGLQLRDLLREAGFTVHMTRETDTSPGGAKNVKADLQARCRISNERQADVFLSLHVNAGGGRGAELYVHGDGGPIAKLAKGVITNVSTICGTHGQAVRDGGPNGTGFAVICNTEADAMLLEIGFIDSDDQPKIQKNIDAFAPLIADAFFDFYIDKADAPQIQPVAPSAPAPIKLDPIAANLAIALYGSLSKNATQSVLVACNYAANSIRRAAGFSIEQNLGKPIVGAADIVARASGTFWEASRGEELRECFHVAAEALRAVK